MAVFNSREEFLSAIQTRIGDDTSDEAIAFVENMTDTYDAMERNEGEDWQKKYEENDKMWREKYTARFYSSESVSENENNDNSTVPEKEVRTYEDLFKTE